MAPSLFVNGFLSSQSFGDRPADDLSKTHWDRVAKLPHGFGPTAQEHVVIGECLNAGALPDSEVSDGIISEADHVFSARNAVIASFECFSGAVQRTAGVTGISSRTGLKNMVVPFVG
jgi:hypothetical protein